MTIYASSQIGGLEMICDACEEEIGDGEGTHFDGNDYCMWCAEALGIEEEEEDPEEVEGE